MDYVLLYVKSQLPGEINSKMLELWEESGGRLVEVKSLKEKLFSGYYQVRKIKQVFILHLCTFV